MPSFPYTPQKIYRALKEPERISKEIRRHRRDFYRWALEVNSRFYRRYRPRASNGISVMDHDWDTLLVLDACRYDLYCELSPLGGTCRPVVSRGSQSWEFMKENFVGRELHDTVCVTANPHTYEIPDGTFHAVEYLLEDYWDESARTVRPSDVVEATFETAERYPNKRLLVHFMQPHFPFLGPTGDSFEHSGVEIHLEDSEQSGAIHPWEGLMFDSSLNPETVITAYRENYEIVFPHVERLVEELPGLTVLTSDHGNLLGEYTFPVPVKTYGHPPGIYRQELLTVPWVQFETQGERRPITTELPGESEKPSEQTIENRLRALGYR